MSVEESQSAVSPLNLAPCLACGGTDIQLVHNQASPFSSRPIKGGGHCPDCGHSTVTDFTRVPTPDLLASIWNQQNDIQVLIKKEQAVILSASAKITCAKVNVNRLRTLAKSRSRPDLLCETEEELAVTRRLAEGAAAIQAILNGRAPLTEMVPVPCPAGGHLLVVREITGTGRQ